MADKKKTKTLMAALIVAVGVVGAMVGCKDAKQQDVAPQAAVQTEADATVSAVVNSPNRIGAGVVVVYGCTPAVGTSTTASKVTMRATCATFNAGLVAKVVSLSSSIAKIDVALSTGAAFGKNGTARLKNGNVCGTEVGNVAFKAADKKVSFTVTLTHLTGSVVIVPTMTFIDESRLYSEPLKFTVVEKSPTLPWDGIVFDEKDFGRVKNGPNPHTGIDVMAAVDTEIKSAGAGVVHSYTSASAAGFGALNPDRAGPAIWITYTDKDGQPFYVLYGHIASSYTGTSSYSISLKSGSNVTDGQVIGKVAPFSNSGKRADHIHMGIFKPKKKPNSNIYYGPPSSGWGYGTISRTEGEFISPNTFFNTVRFKAN